MLRVYDLRVPGLTPVRLDLERGECLAVEGPSGSGKSRLLRAIADLDVNTGSLSLDGAPRESMSAPAWRRRVVYLATDAGWWGERVAEHFAGFARLSRDLEALGFDSDCGAWPVSRLSTGERQRLALLRALSVEPEVLLLDEPTSGLDPAATQAVEELLARRRRGGLAVLWVTHDPDQARRVGGRRLAIRGDEVRPA